jgi:zinc protease
MRKLNKQKITLYIKYLVVFIGALFLFISLVYKKEETTGGKTAMTFEDFLGKVEYPSVKGIENILHFENNVNNIISIDIIFKGGSALDPKDKEGLANFLVSSMVLSAGGYSVSEFAKMLDEYSINISTQVNRDSISIKITTLNYYKSRAFNLLRLMLNSPNLGSDEIQLTKNNIIAEYNIKSTQPKYLVSKALREEIFGKHNYFREIIGTPATISKFDTKTLKSFKDNIFTKKNMYISISGHISKKEVEKEFKTITEQLPDGDIEFLFMDYVTPKFPNKVISVPFKGASQSEVLIAFASPSYNSLLYPYAVLLNTYMGRMPDSLLFDQLRNQNGLVYTISSNLYQDNITNFWLISLGTSLEKADESIALVKNNLQKLKQGKYDFNSVIIAKNWMLDNELRNFSSNSNISSYLNQMQFLGFSIDKTIATKKLYDYVRQDKINQVIADINMNEITVVKIVAEKVNGKK